MSISQNLQALINNLQDEINATNKEFKLMLELRKVIMAEYELMAKEYCDMKTEIKSEIMALEALREAIQKEREEMVTERFKLLGSKNRHTERKTTWSSVYPLKSFRPL